MLEPTVRSNWQGEKPKPRYNSRWQLPPFTRNRAFRLVALFVFVATAITLYMILAWNREPEHDLEKATREYNEYLASPEHRALKYPAPDDRAHGKAAIIALVRNNELDQMAQSMKELEETFNRKFKYPWIFFNDEPFDDKFKRITKSLTDAETQYGSAAFSALLICRGHSKRALGCAQLDSSRLDAGIVRKTPLGGSTIRENAVVS
jgi:Glycolipid 2-alpha-mannosyltransferase